MGLYSADFVFRLPKLHLPVGSCLGQCSQLKRGCEKRLIHPQAVSSCVFCYSGKLRSWTSSLIFNFIFLLENAHYPPPPCPGHYMTLETLMWRFCRAGYTLERQALPLSNLLYENKRRQVCSGLSALSVVIAQAPQPSTGHRILVGPGRWLKGSSVEEKLREAGQVWEHRIWVAWCGGLGLRESLCH